MPNENIFGLILIIAFALVLGAFIFVSIRSSKRSRNYKKKLMNIDDVETLRKAVGYDESLVKKLAKNETLNKSEVLPSGEIVCHHCGFINAKQSKKCICCGDKLDI